MLSNASIELVKYSAWTGTGRITWKTYAVDISQIVNLSNYEEEFGIKAD